MNQPGISNIRLGFASFVDCHTFQMGMAGSSIQYPRDRKILAGS
jgi:hypothetical protein